MHIVSDATICAAYIAIPLALLVFVRRRKDFEFPRIVWLFFAFILSCGIAHGFEAAIFWWPAYRVTGVLKAITALVSVTTVIALIRVIPIALTIPSLTRENRELTKQLDKSREAETSLTMAREQLEQRAAQLAVKERRMRDANVSARAVGVCWDIDSNAILWEIGYLPLLKAVDVDGYSNELSWLDLLGPEQVAALKRHSDTAWRSGSSMHLRFALQHHRGEWDLRMTVSPEPAAAGQPRSMIGLFGLVPFGQSRMMEDNYPT
ncbi:MAG TPA: hypothetical protein VK157_06125 [Phycisphaerales bacterium]|nr:hypothetical protein [Phycisphaerales bacterium]